MQTTLVLSSILLWILTLLNLALTVALARRLRQGLRRGHEPDKLPAGREAPPFQLQALAGEARELKSFAGRALALVIVSPSCIGCSKIPALLARLQDDASARGLSLALISAASEEETRAYAGGSGLKIPVLLAPRSGSSFFADYRVPGTPFHYFLDAGGRVAAGDFFSEDNFHRDWRTLDAQGALAPGLAKGGDGKKPAVLLQPAGLEVRTEPSTRS